MYLQLHSVKEPSKNHGIWHLGSCTLFFLTFRFGWVLARFVLAEFGFFPISNAYVYAYMYTYAC